LVEEVEKFVSWGTHAMVKQQQKHMWIGDSGASCHFTNDDTGFNEWRHINNVIGVGNNDVSIAKVGTLCLELIQQYGNTNIITLNNCTYIPELHNNLFSITRAFTKGWKLSTNGIKLLLSKPTRSEKGCIIFDTIDPTTSVIVMMVQMIPSHHI
jgi:hypothetical protein